jgi:hypothetical protein
MELRVGYWIITMAIIGWYCTFTCAEDLKPNITPIDSHAGLYFNEIGHFLYPTQWKVVSYVNLKPTQSLWQLVKARQSEIVNYCLKIHNITWYSLTDCRAFTPYIGSKVK